MKLKLNKNEKNTSGELNEIKMPKQEEKDSGGNDLLQFFIGIVLLGAGLFMLSKRVMVHSSWYVWQIGGFDLSSGTVTIPLIIGIILYFMYTGKQFHTGTARKDTRSDLSLLSE